MKDIILTDVSFESQLRNYVGSKSEGHPLWTSVYLKENPEACRRVHQDYIQSGAEMIFTSTYQASVEGFQKHWRLSKGEALELLKLSVKLCKEAVQLEKEKGNQSSISVLGSVGPYGAYLHDGSEYTGGHYIDSMSVEQVVEWHTPKVNALLQAGVDGLIFPTIPSQKEAESVILVLKKFPGAKAILSFSAQNEKNTSHGENLSVVAQHCWDLASDQILAIGVNCQHPRLTVPLLTSISMANPQIPLFVRSNTTEMYNTATKGWEEVDSGKMLTEYCQDWLKMGVKYIGGCCRTTVEDISGFKKQIDNFKSKQN